MRHSFLLFTIILLEGYIVLAAELLAIRQVIPYVGSGTDTVSIIIAAVLMPLAFGYYAGGRYKATRPRLPIRECLTRNIFISAIFLIPGLSFQGVETFFLTLIQNDVNDRMVMVTLYAFLFIVTPVFLLGQTVPLVSNYFSARRLSQITGRMLFASTIGSFLGSVVSTIVLMQTIGVNNTANILIALLAVLIILLSRRKVCDRNVIAVGMALFMFFINSNQVLRNAYVVENNAYNTIQVFEDDLRNRHLMLNGSYSSMLGPSGQKYPYIEYVEKYYLDPIKGKDIPPKNILVVGSAGFTFGLEDTKNDYVYVDIDKSVKPVAEEHFLKDKLTPNKRFVGEDVRAYLATDDHKFDLIFLDAYLGLATIPETLVTQDFYQQIKKSLAPNGILLINFILSPNFNDHFSQRTDNTLRSVFPHLNRQILDPAFNGWEENKSIRSNIIYVYHHNPDEDNKGIYTDNRNGSAYDKPRKTVTRITDR